MLNKVKKTVAKFKGFIYKTHMANNKQNETIEIWFRNKLIGKFSLITIKSIAKAYISMFYQIRFTK